MFAVLYVGFEYTSAPPDPSALEDLLDDMQKDLELMPPVDSKDMISAESPAAAPKAITTKVKEVEHTADENEKVNPNSNPLLVGDGSGEVKQAEVTEALPQTPAQNPEDNPYHFRVVEELPQFPGGWVEFMKFLNKNIKYPVVAQNKKIQGKVVVSFIVNKDGSVSAMKVSQSLDPSLDREALRVLKMMPKWTPGQEKGKPCRTMIAIPINFQL